VTRLGRRPLVLAAVAFAGALVGYQLLPRDEKRINALLQELCGRLNQTRDPATLGALREFLTVALLPEVSLHATELAEDCAKFCGAFGTLQGLELVSARAGDLLNEPPLTFALSNVEVRVSDRLARVDADLEVSVRGGAEQRRQVRHSRVRLAKRAGRWQIEAIEVDPIVPSEPEARP